MACSIVMARPSAMAAANSGSLNRLRQCARSFSNFASSSCCQCHADLRAFPEVFYNSMSQSFFCNDCKQSSCYLLSSLGYGLLRAILCKPISTIVSSETWAVRSCQDELSLVIENLLRKNFERDLGCLQLVHSEA